MKKFGWPDLVWAFGVAGAAVAAFYLFRTPEPARTGLAHIMGGNVTELDSNACMVHILQAA